MLNPYRRPILILSWRRTRSLAHPASWRSLGCRLCLRHRLRMHHFTHPDVDQCAPQRDNHSSHKRGNNSHQIRRLHVQFPLYLKTLYSERSFRRHG